MLERVVHTLSVAAETLVRIVGQVRRWLALSWHGLALVAAALVTIAALTVVLSAESDAPMGVNGWRSA